MYFKKLYLLFFFLFFTGKAGTFIQPSTNSAPYIYYYSAEKTAFIVERADGTDSRTLASSVTIPKDQYIVGPAWSNSGQWFAWTTQSGYGTGGLQNVYVVEKSNDTKIPIFKYDVTMRHLKWSPKIDRLLLVYYETYVDGTEPQKAIIYEPSTKSIIASRSMRDFFPNEEDSVVQATWSPDGNYIAFDGSSRVVITTPDLRLVQIINTSSNWIVFCNQPRGINWQLSRWINNDHIAYLGADSGKLVIEQIKTGLQDLFVLQTSNRYMYYESLTQKYALIFGQSSQSEFKSNVFLMSIKGKSVSSLNLVVDTPDECYLPIEDVVWNAQDEAFVRLDGQIGILFASTQILAQIDVPARGKLENSRPVIWLPSGELVFAWSLYLPDSSIYTNGTQLYVYSPKTKSLEPLFNSGDEALNHDVWFITAFHNNRIIYAEKGILFILDTTTKKRTALAFPSSPIYGEYAASSAYVHPTQDWLFALSENMETSHLIAVANADGTISRQLALCGQDQATSCYGWMP